MFRKLNRNSPYHSNLNFEIKSAQALKRSSTDSSKEVTKVNSLNSDKKSF